MSSLGIKNVMQKEVFDPDEKLKSLISVIKPSGRSKKKPSFLTLSVVQQGSQAIANLGRVKVLDKKESSNTYKRVKTWPISDLKVVDCHQDAAELDFKFDRQIFKWVVVNVVDKRPFILSLYRVVRKHYGLLQIRFMNFENLKLELTQSVSGADVKVEALEDTEEILDQEEYRELTAQEEADLEELLGRENAIQDAASFMEHLTEELAQLDQSNIHALMGSEEQIEKLMEYLEGGIAEVESMEMRLNVYDELLSNVRDTMQKLGSQYSHILRQNQNLKALCKEVEEIINKLDLEPQVETVLQECPLGSRTNIQDCVMAAQMLHKALCQELSQGLTIIQAVTDQSKFFSDLSSSFGKRLQEYLASQFLNNAATMMEVRQSLVSHSHVHNDLLAYQDLTKWLKDCQPVIFAELKDLYIRSFKHVYEEQLRNLMAEIRMVLQHGRQIEGRKGASFITKLSTSTSDIRSSLSGSMSSLSPAKGTNFSTQSVVNLTASSSTESAHGITFDKAFPVVLDQIQPICVAERKFLNTFFHFERVENMPEMLEEDGEELDKEVEVGGEEDVDGLRFGRKKEVIQKLNGDLDGPIMLNQLFGSLLRELEEFVDFAEKLDSYNALFLLVYVNQRLMFALESGGTPSYLDETLSKSLLHIRRIFDKFIEEKVKMIQESKVSKGSRCGILSCVKHFGEFAEKSERIIMGTDRRTELDKAYMSLIDAVFGSIEHLAHEHPRTPADVIKFENYNKIVDILSRLKIVCLDPRKDEARKRCRSHKAEYVKNCLGQPMDKLSVFFEGVQNLRASGTKGDEVGFRLEFSKNELRKCIKEYPGKEVKRGLEKLYRRVEKEVSEGELQVVWISMQSAFILQCQKFQSLISECYPGSNITLEFSIADLTDYFATISKLS